MATTTAEGKKEKGNVELIVRVLGKDLDGNKSIESALRKIKGVDHRMAEIAAQTFRKETNFPEEKKLGEVSKEQAKQLEEILAEPTKHGIPAWALNRRKDYETGKDTHKTMNELDFALRNDNQRLAGIKSYRGLRKSWGLTVRGQKTKGAHRGKGGVGVARKEQKK